MVNLTKSTDPILPLGPERITELARGVVTDQWLIVDIEDERWQQSLTLLLQAARGVPENIGAVLVPVAPHLRGWWTGSIPAVTLEAQYVPGSDLEQLYAEINRMNAALWPADPEQE